MVADTNVSRDLVLCKKDRTTVHMVWAGGAVRRSFGECHRDGDCEGGICGTKLVAAGVNRIAV